MKSAQIHFTGSSIEGLPQSYRTNLINSLSGYKSANLVGTISPEGNTNLAIISSVVHIGANPPALGMIMRPNSVRRDTLENILTLGCYTINHVSTDIIDKAHQTSARYEKGISEFDATGLATEFLNNFPSPFVQESPIKFGMKLVEKINIAYNDTWLIIGEITELFLPQEALHADGRVDLTRSHIACICGLDSYFEPRKIARFSYAKPDKKLQRLE